MLTHTTKHLVAAYALALCAFVLPAWVCRFFAIAGLDLSKLDLLGVFSDFAAALLMISIVLLLPTKVLRLLFLPVTLIHSIFQYANFEVIGVLDGNIDLTLVPFAFHKTFIIGSLFAVKNYWLLFSTIAAGLIPSLLFLRYLPLSQRLRVKLLFCIYGLCAVLFSYKLLSFTLIPRWRQYSVFLDSTQLAIAPGLGILSPVQRFGRGIEPDNEPLPVEKFHLGERVMRPDLEGKSILNEPENLGKNVLIIIVRKPIRSISPRAV